MEFATEGPYSSTVSRTPASEIDWSTLGSSGSPRQNVATVERIGSAAIGAALVTYGLRRRGPGGIAAALLGGVFLHRGATGHCHVYEALGLSTGSAEAVLDQPLRPDVSGRSATVNARKAIKVERNVTIQRSPEELYAFWHNFENLPRFMQHLVSVKVLSPTRSRWVARGPAGLTVEWDAELVNDVPSSLIAWKSLPGADVPNAGSVHFTELPANRGTMVKVEMDVEIPAGKLGLAVAKIFGEDPERDVLDDLRRFKRLMESAEIPSSPPRVDEIAYVSAVVVELTE
jgi:uncharacterized membrane protein